jgi:TatD DNase family protein
MKPAEILARAQSAGVDLVVHIGTDVASSRFGVELSRSHPSVRAAVALHPNEAPEIALASGQSGLDLAISEIESLANSPFVSAIGETGLDFFRTGAEGRPYQEHSFREHIRIAKSVAKPLVVHDRDAHTQILDILAETKPPIVVLHCFSGDEAIAKECVARGYYISFAGNVTFKNSESLRAALQVVPLDQLLVETDAPFLTPMPYRGKTNSSYLIPLIIDAIAGVRNESSEDLARATWQNTLQIFGDSPSS